MSKEQEAFNRISEAMDYADDMANSHYEVGDFEIVENALKRLESIDNANPSEALECLERIDNTLCLNNIKGKLDFGIDTEEHTDCDSVIGMTEDLESIKQALLKAEKEHNSVNLLMQELDCKDFAGLRKYARCGYEKLNKKYLKWEDLEFDYGVWKNVEVVLNGTKYTLNCYKNCIEYTYVKIYLNGIVVADLCSTYKADKQFFNDLHLERVEE